MQQILYLIQKYRYFLLFVFLEFIALTLTFQSHQYHKSKFISSANAITGGLYEQTNKINEFFVLKDENKRLSSENTDLKNQLERQKVLQSFQTVVDTSHSQQFKYISAKVTQNNYRNKRNYIYINKGTNDGVKENMGVINSEGIIGITVDATKNYAVILSILNEYSSINVRLKNNNYIGSLTWDTNDFRTAQLTDIPREAPIKKGDTIVSGGHSSLFPAGIPIGTIKDFKFDRNIYENIDVSLFNNMSALGYVQVIQNLHKKEIDSLKQSVENEQ